MKCPHCEKEVTRKRYGVIYCSDRCARNAQDKRKRIRDNGYMHIPKKCIVCDETFSPTRVTHLICSKKCRYEYNGTTQYYKNKKLWQVILVDEKLNFCTKCGYDKYFGAIDFHHPNEDRNGEKNKTAAYMFSQKPTPERIAFVKKCVPMCATCHREYHIENKTLGTFTKNKEIK